MAQQVDDQRVPDSVQPPYTAIVSAIDVICGQHLNAEYAVLGRRLAAALARKRPSPLVRGKPEVWACGIMYALGTVNFLFGGRADHAPRGSRDRVSEGPHPVRPCGPYYQGGRRIRDLIGPINQPPPTGPDRPPNGGRRSRHSRTVRQSDRLTGNVPTTILDSPSLRESTRCR